MDHQTQQKKLDDLLEQTKDQVITASVVSTLSLVPGLAPLAMAMTPGFQKMVTEIKGQMSPSVIAKSETRITKEFNEIVSTVRQEERSKIDATPHHIATQLEANKGKSIEQGKEKHTSSLLILEEKIVQLKATEGVLTPFEETRLIKIQEFTVYAEQSQTLVRQAVSTDPQKIHGIVEELGKKCETAKGSSLSKRSLDAKDKVNEAAKDLENLENEARQKTEQFVRQKNPSRTQEECHRGCGRAFERADKRLRENKNPQDVMVKEVVAEEITEEFSLSSQDKQELIAQQGTLFVERHQKILEVEELFQEYLTSLCDELILFVETLILEEEQKSHERQKEIDEERYEVERDEVKRDILRQSIQSADLARQNNKERVKITHVKEIYRERVENQYRLTQDRYREEEHDRLEAFRRKIFETDRTS